MGAGRERGVCAAHPRPAAARGALRETPLSSLDSVSLESCGHTSRMTNKLQLFEAEMSAEYGRVENDTTKAQNLNITSHTRAKQGGVERGPGREGAEGAGSGSGLGQGGARASPRPPRAHGGAPLSPRAAV